MSTQQAHFDELYAAFHTFYQEALKTADAPNAKVRLQLTTVFFDDLALLKAVGPVFARFATTVEDKRAVARAAYYDALLTHKLSTFNSAIVTQLFQNDEDAEKRIAKLEKAATK